MSFPKELNEMAMKYATLTNKQGHNWFALPKEEVEQTLLLEEMRNQFGFYATQEAVKAAQSIVNIIGYFDGEPEE